MLLMYILYSDEFLTVASMPGPIFGSCRHSNMLTENPDKDTQICRDVEQPRLLCQLC